MWNVECGVWSEICFQEQVTLYMNTLSQYYSHSTLHIPHSSKQLHKKSRSKQNGFLFYLFFSKSRISVSSFSSAGGSGAGAGSSSFFLVSLFMALIMMKIHRATIRKSMMF